MEKEKVVSEKQQRKQEVAVKNKLWKSHLRNHGLEFDDDLNPRHTQFYKLQLPALKLEWRSFSAIMTSCLPASFRLSDRISPALKRSTHARVENLSEAMQKRFLEFDGEVLDKSCPLLSSVSWLPGAYAARVDNRFLSHCDGLQTLHHFLSNATACGYLVRQELASMLPVVLLDPRAHHNVLDVCGAPGSKTEQLLASMTANSHSATASPGVLVANDADPKRLHTLRGRFENNPSTQLLVTCLDGTALSTAFPASLAFDRILCDVPCSGDGTFRKCPHLYRLFRPRHGLELHSIQLRILIEALSILRVGGRLAYSTCSLSPIEDEAVVAAALRHYNNSHSPSRPVLKLLSPSELDLAQRLPGIRLRSGVTTWCSDTEVFCLGEETSADREQTLRRIRPHLQAAAHTLHAPTEPAIVQQLPHCMRLLPHDQDTGGFFIAVFEKLADHKRSSNTVSQSSAQSVDVAEGAMKELGYNPKANARVEADVKREMLSMVSGSERRAVQVEVKVPSELAKRTFEVTASPGRIMMDAGAEGSSVCCLMNDQVHRFLQDSQSHVLRDRIAAAGVELGVVNTESPSRVLTANAAHLQAIGHALSSGALQLSSTTPRCDVTLDDASSYRQFISAMLQHVQVQVPVEAAPSSQQADTACLLPLRLRLQRVSESQWKVDSIQVESTVSESGEDAWMTCSSYTGNLTFNPADAIASAPEASTAADAVSSHPHKHLLLARQLLPPQQQQQQQHPKTAHAHIASSKGVLLTIRANTCGHSQTSGSAAVVRAGSTGMKKRKSRAEQRASKKARLQPSTNTSSTAAVGGQGAEDEVVDDDCVHEKAPEQSQAQPLPALMLLLPAASHWSVADGSGVGDSSSSSTLIVNVQSSWFMNPVVQLATLRELQY